MRIRKYLALIKTVECGSLTKAADLMNYTQSGISRMISDLEEEWGITLLERNRSGVNLTSDGLKLYPKLKQICTEHHYLLSQIDDLKGIQTGLIRIGTFSSVATHWLPNMIKCFKIDYPKIEFELLLGDYREIEQWIADGRVDFGFLRLPTLPEFETTVIQNDRLMVVLPNNHPSAKIDTFPIKSLEASPFILLEKGSKSEVSELFEQHKISPHIEFTTWDDYAVMSMVEKGLGISILPELILKRIPYQIISKEMNISAHRTIGIAMRSERQLSIASKRFLDYLDYRE